MSERIQLSHALGTASPNTWDDFAWARKNRVSLFEQFGAVVVLIYDKQVIGKGRTIVEAEEDALKHIATEEKITLIIFFVERPGARISGFFRRIDQQEAHDPD